VRRGCADRAGHKGEFNDRLPACGAVLPAKKSNSRGTRPHTRKGGVEREIGMGRGTVIVEVGVCGKQDGGDVWK